MIEILGILLSIVVGAVLLIVVCALFGIVVGGMGLFIDFLSFLIGGGAVVLIIAWLFWHFVLKDLLKK